jgi:uncharacterized protein YbjT (DUF2867 family)
VPWTILRATQFHDLVLRALRILDRLPILLIPKGFVGQSIDTGEVADHLIALASPAGRVPDVGGPEVLTSSELARTYLEVIGLGKRLVELQVHGRAARAWRDGAQICSDRRYGRVRWEEFLHDTFQRQWMNQPGRERVS